MVNQMKFGFGVYLLFLLNNIVTLALSTHSADKMEAILEKYENLIDNLRKDKEDGEKLIENLKFEIKELKNKNSGGNKIKNGKFENFDREEGFGKDSELSFFEKFLNNSNFLVVSNSVLNTHPCLNKGYYNKILKVSGDGDYFRCKTFIQDKSFNSKFQKKSFNSTFLYNFNITPVTANETIILDHQFKNFKFLFYKKQGENIYNFKENLKYEDLKNKTTSICGSQYSRLISDISKFNIK